MIYIEHPEYRREKLILKLPYDFTEESEKLTVQLKHWDLSFRKLENDLEKQPNNELELLYSHVTDFERHLGQLRSYPGWLNQVPAEMRAEVKEKYLPWINGILMDYPEIMCKSLEDCKYKTEKGTLGDYKLTSYPFN